VLEGSRAIVRGESRLTRRGGRWREHECMLQTFPAALVARALDAKPGEAVLDMCAAPGGKVRLTST
jgi:16S rRNA C967 or C1407 C5-methylase (RsmB/RsmF family)